jgi:hypothetical protein
VGRSSIVAACFYIFRCSLVAQCSLVAFMTAFGVGVL